MIPAACDAGAVVAVECRPVEVESTCGEHIGVVRKDCGSVAAADGRTAGCVVVVVVRIA